MTESPYRSRYLTRERTKALRSNILFGLMIGWLLTLTGAVHYFLLDEGGLWPVWLAIGIIVLCLTVAMPDLLVYPRNALAKVAGWLGEAILKGLLLAVFFGAVVPGGVILRKVKGQTPYYAWDSTAPATTEGWVEKLSSDESDRVRHRKNRSGSLFQIGELIGYFIRHGELMLVPCLLIFLVIGLLVIFAQSSAVAPMIYTLF